jgi:hypothetical protein
MFSLTAHTGESEEAATHSQTKNPEFRLRACLLNPDQTRTVPSNSKPFFPSLQELLNAS